MPYCHIHHLAVTLPQALTEADLPQLLQDLFGISDVDPAAIKDRTGRHGYRSRYTLKGEHGGELVSILLDGVGRNLTGTSHIVIHGVALELGRLDVPAICQQILERNGWAAEIHLAADDHAGLLPWEEIKDASRFDRYRDRITTRLCKPSKDLKTGELKENPPVLMVEEGESLYFGKASSETSLCLYTRRGPIRAEVRLRNRATATDVVSRIAAGDDLGPITAGLLRHNLVFHDPGYMRKDRRPVCQWWNDFLEGAEVLTLPKARQIRNRSPWYVRPDPLARLREEIIRQLDGPDSEKAGQMLAEIMETWGATFRTQNSAYDCVGANSTGPNSVGFSEVEVTAFVPPPRYFQTIPNDFAPDITF